MPLLQRHYASREEIWAVHFAGRMAAKLSLTRPRIQDAHWLHSRGRSSGAGDDKDGEKRSLKVQQAGFIEPMDCLAVSKLPEGPRWPYEIKLDGFQVEAVKAYGQVALYSRHANVLNAKFPYIAADLEGLPDRTEIDGELVAWIQAGAQIST